MSDLAGLPLLPDRDLDLGADHQLQAQVSALRQSLL